MISNGFTKAALAALLAGSQLATAHREIQHPAPFRSKYNPNSVNIDYTNTAPLSASGADYPCKGYHVDFGTEAGKPTASYVPGGSYNFTLAAGGAAHGGGSCQVSLSYDRGATFTVIQSIIGGCPLDSSYPFTVPADAPEGEAIWAWTWQNNIGNREQYMNCAAVTIGGGGGAKREVKSETKSEVKKRAVSFSARPKIFLANISNGCSTTEGTDVVYPDPGPDVINNGGSPGQPVGDCGAAGPAPVPDNGNANDNGNGNGGGDAPSSTAQDPVTSAPTPIASDPVSLPGGVFITVPASSVAQPAPTTLVVSTRPNPPAATGGAGSGSGSGSGSGAGAGGYAVGTACTSEGAWNCIGGTSFQRCASGAWSAVMQMAGGTTCQSGESATLSLVGRKLRTRRRQAAKLRA